MFVIQNTKKKKEIKLYLMPRSNMKNVFLIWGSTYQWCRPYSSKVFSITVVWFMTRYLGWRLWIRCPCSRISFFSVIFFLLGKETNIIICCEHSSGKLSRKLNFKDKWINKSQRHNSKKQKQKMRMLTFYFQHNLNQETLFPQWMKQYTESG